MKHNQTLINNIIIILMKKDEEKLAKLTFLESIFLIYAIDYESYTLGIKGSKILVSRKVNYLLIKHFALVLAIDSEVKIRKF